jgi:hypothetical protein
MVNEVGMNLTKEDFQGIKSGKIIHVGTMNN